MAVTGEFSVISKEEGTQTPRDLSAVGAAQVFVFDEVLYEDLGSWDEVGPERGELHASCVVSQGGRSICTLTFWFNDGGSITAGGVLPVEKNGVGEGVLSVTGGTGTYHDRGGEVQVELHNPKRWTFIP